jgi:sugar phosphate isomerase/epimerase
MQLQLIRHLWGVEMSWETAFPRIAQEGFVGIECPMPEARDESRFLDLLAQQDFTYLAMAFTAGERVADHVTSFRSQVDRAAALGAVKLTCHSGRDAWSASEAADYFGAVLEIEQHAGLPVGHETHRGRQLFNPWQTNDLLRQFPSLMLCCDFSHWVCVAERLLGDCQPIMEHAARRCIHIHARVGYEEGPQVPDPSAPEYARHLTAHESWWDLIWASQRQRGDKISTLTPEFGPPGYMHTLPHTNMPVADLWSVCKWMADRQMQRFAS